MFWIKTVAEMTGIPRNTLIAWERRYDLIQPERAASGYRVYSEDDVAVLRKVQGLIAAGHRISEAARMVREVDVTPVRMPERALELPDADRAGLESYRGQLLAALLQFDRHSAERIVRRLFLIPFETQLDQIYLPLLWETGRRWEVGEVSVVQEHFVSSWCREQILVMTRSLEPLDSSAPEAICATPVGDPHEFGLLAVAFKLAKHGYRLLYLGANVPSDQLVQLVKERQPALVAISVVLTRDDAELVDFGEQIVAVLGDEGCVIIGGRGVAGLASRSTPRLRFGGAIPRPHSAR